MFKLELEKAEEREVKLPTSDGSQTKQQNSRKTFTSTSLTTLKSLYGSQQTGKFLKIWEYQTTLPNSSETSMEFNNQQLQPDMEKWTGSKLGKEYAKAVLI